MAAGGQRWAAPVAGASGPSVRQGSTAVVFSPLSWWFVVWRARVHEASTGNVEARLSAIAEAMEHSDALGGVPGLHRTGPASVSFEFWFEARTEREAAGGARIALRQACRAASVGGLPPKAWRHRL